MIGLGWLEQGPDMLSTAWSVNDRGQVVGTSHSRIAVVYAYIWDFQHGMRRLNDLLDPCTQPPYDDCESAAAINNPGQIIAGPRLGHDLVLLTPYLVGDLDEDGDVDVVDLTRLLASFGRDGDAVYADGDLDCDARVGLSDLTLLLSSFGEVLP